MICRFSLCIVDIAHNYVRHTIVLLHERYIERWLRMPLAGKQFTAFNNAVASVLCAYINHSLSDN